MLLNSAERRSLPRPVRSGRDFCSFVEGVISFGLLGLPELRDATLAVSFSGCSPDPGTVTGRRSLGWPGFLGRG